MTKKCKSYACLLSKEHVYTRSYEGGGYPILHSLKLTPQSIRRDCLILCPPPSSENYINKLLTLVIWKCVYD